MQLKIVARLIYFCNFVLKLIFVTSNIALLSPYIKLKKNSFAICKNKLS